MSSSHSASDHGTKSSSGWWERRGLVDPLVAPPASQSSALTMASDPWGGTCCNDFGFARWLNTADKSHI